jgi:hypothetical protein
MGTTFALGNYQLMFPQMNYINNVSIYYNSLQLLTTSTLLYLVLIFNKSFLANVTVLLLKLQAASRIRFKLQCQKSFKATFSVLEMIWDLKVHARVTLVDH